MTYDYAWQTDGYGVSHEEWSGKISEDSKQVGTLSSDSIKDEGRKLVWRRFLVLNGDEFLVDSGVEL